MVVEIELRVEQEGATATDGVPGRRFGGEQCGGSKHRGRDDERLGECVIGGEHEGGPGESGLERTDCMQGGMRVNSRHEVLGVECACAVIAIAGRGRVA